MKKLIATIIIAIIFFVSTNPVYATNTYTTDFENSAAENMVWSINDVDQTGLDLSTAFTIELYTNPESFPSDGYYVSKYSNGTVDASYRFDTKADGKLQLVVSDDGSQDTNGHLLVFRTTSSVISAGSWQHIAVTFDVGTETAIFYVDGSFVASSLLAGTTMGPTLRNSTAPFIIGGLKIGAGNVDGLVDDVRVWNDIRTSTEISDNYNCSLDGSESGLVGYWRFDGAISSGTEDDDSTSNGNHLTNNNFVTTQNGSLPFTDSCSAPPAAERRNYMIN